jgi:hypothetical protein
LAPRRHCVKLPRILTPRPSTAYPLSHCGHVSLSVSSAALSLCLRRYLRFGDGHSSSTYSSTCPLHTSLHRPLSPLSKPLSLTASSAVRSYVHASHAEVDIAQSTPVNYSGSRSRLPRSESPGTQGLDSSPLATAFKERRSMNTRAMWSLWLHFWNIRQGLPWQSHEDV